MLQKKNPIWSGLNENILGQYHNNAKLHMLQNNSTQKI